VRGPISCLITDFVACYNQLTCLDVTGRDIIPLGNAATRSHFGSMICSGPFWVNEKNKNRAQGIGVIKKGPIYVQLGYYLGQAGQPNLGRNKHCFIFFGLSGPCSVLVHRVSSV